MFISREEKQLILDVLELLEKRLGVLEERLDKIETAKWGLKLDGTPKAKPGKKPQK